MPSVALRTRINQITILIAVSFLIYQITAWVEGIWVLYSTIVAAGPISTFLGYEKAKDRFLGTLVGVLAAFCLETFVRHNPSLLPVIAVGIAMMVGFMVTRPYKYFIIMITICTCMSYTYMNMPYTSFEPVSFMIDRTVGVFVGVMIFLVIQEFVFGTANAKLELLETSHGSLKKLQGSLRQFQANPSLMTAYQCATDILMNSKDIKSYVGTAHYVLGTEKGLELRYARQVLLLNNRALKILVDEPAVSMQKVQKLLHIVDLKLERQ